MSSPQGGSVAWAPHFDKIGKGGIGRSPNEGISGGAGSPLTRRLKFHPEAERGAEDGGRGTRKGERFFLLVSGRGKGGGAGAGSMRGAGPKDFLPAPEPGGWGVPQAEGGFLPRQSGGTPPGTGISRTNRASSGKPRPAPAPAPGPGE